MIVAYREHDRDQMVPLTGALIEGGRTLNKPSAHVLAYFDRFGT